MNSATRVLRGAAPVNTKPVPDRACRAGGRTGLCCGLAVPLQIVGTWDASSSPGKPPAPCCWARGCCCERRARSALRSTRRWTRRRPAPRRWQASEPPGPPSLRRRRGPWTPGVCSAVPTRGRASRTVTAVTGCASAASRLQTVGFAARSVGGRARELGRQQDQRAIVRPHLRRAGGEWRSHAEQRVQEAPLLLLLGEVLRGIRTRGGADPDARGGARGRAVHARQGEMGAGLRGGG